MAFWLVSTLFLGIGAIGANPSDDSEAGFVGRIGDERAAAGLGGLVVAPDLVDVARRHAEEMRRQQRLHHNPSLGEDVQGWQSVGENVGVGPSVEEIHRELMASPSHRDNILSGRFTEVGVGVVVDGSSLWVVQVFRLPESPPPPPTQQSAAADEPAPAPEPRPAPPAPSSSAPAGGTVRAANATGSAPTGTAPAVPPTTSAPAAPTTSAASPTTAPTPVEVPTSLVEATASTAAADPLPADTATSDARHSTATPGEQFGSASPRQVTWPMALAATMLLSVVIALGVHVAGAKVRSVAAGRRPSLLDVWELALAG